MKYGKNCFICKKRIMALYHPPEMITANQAPIISADLKYENHGKCKKTTVLSNHTGITTFVAGQDDFGEGNGWKVVFLEETTLALITTNNIPATETAAFTSVGFSFAVGTEIMADIVRLRIIEGTCIIYKNCNQS